jgi:hypothetical protein
MGFSHILGFGIVNFVVIVALSAITNGEITASNIFCW